MTTSWAVTAAARMAQLMNLLDAAFPGRIAGVHLASLADGENRYACPPENYGYSDYSTPLQEEFCRLWQRQRQQHNPTQRSTACVVPTAQDRCTPTSGNLFVSNASAEYNLFLSHQVRSAISAHAAAVKTASGNKALVLAFYGYLNELGGHRIAGSGHLELAELLADTNVDGIVSPYKYGASFRHPAGPLASMGPMDAPTLRGKLWISEDDTRTSFSHAGPPFLSCTDTVCDVQLMRRNIFTSVLHGAGVYQFDLLLGGWFGQPGAGPNTTSTKGLWDAIGTARRVAEELFAMGAADPELRPEIAVFIDDASMGHVRLNGVGTCARSPFPIYDSFHFVCKLLFPVRA